MSDSPPKRWVAIQRNPRSGSGRQRSRLVNLISALRQRGFQPSVFRDRQKLAERLADPRSQSRLACIVAAGGDGTVADVFNRFPGIPIAIFPMGTENLLARYLKVSASGEELAGLIAAGSRRRFDLGLVGERRFALMLSAGLDAEIVHRVHRTRTGHIRRVNYIPPILESLRSYDYPPLWVTVDDAPSANAASLAMIMNIPAYALGLPVAKTARGDDGRFDLRLFERGSGFQIIRYLCNLALGTHEQLPDVVSLAARRVRIDADRPVPLQADGDPAGFTPAEVRLLPGALEVYAPSGE